MECDFSFTANGFQLIAQPTDLNQQYRHYVSENMDPHTTTATVSVSETGEYQIFVLPIFEELGITESSVVYSETVVITEPTATGMYVVAK